MRVLTLSKEGSLKIKKREKALYKKDFQEIPKSILPGEWCLFLNEKTGEHLAGFVNLHVMGSWPLAFVVTEMLEKNYDPLCLIQEKIDKAIHYRKIFFKESSRLVFGEHDELPGLVVDQFENIILIQINTAGMDQFREPIKQIIEKQFPHHEVLLLDQESYRSHESLPLYPVKGLSHPLKIIENGLHFEVSSEILQKVGYYYDHRSNRKRALEIIQQSTLARKNGLDLFSYVGSWGMHLLKAGLEEMHFVDQGNFAEAIKKNSELNGFQNKTNFTRMDCFKFLDECEKENKTFDVICSDPPAFTKNMAGKPKAIEGYTKLHTKVLKSIRPQGLALIGSCTHYVSLEELDQTMQEASYKAQRKIKLLDMGLQGKDHPIKGLSDKGNYIKFLAYFVE